MILQPLGARWHSWIIQLTGGVYNIVVIKVGQCNPQWRSLLREKHRLVDPFFQPKDQKLPEFQGRSFQVTVCLPVMISEHVLKAVVVGCTTGPTLDKC